jgi:ABC-type branched-subunit amino acid transport system substrate-binding protein
LLTSFGMRGGRLMRNWVAELDRIHYLDGQKIAILSGESTDPSGSTANALKAALQGAGHPVVRVSRFSADRGTGSSQIPVEVSQTKASGATSVFLLSDGVYSAQFAQQADSQGYRPRYTTSPWTGNDTDAAMQNMPAGADGMVGVTAAYPFTSWPVTPPAKRCIDTYETRSGRKLAGPKTNEFITTMLYCDLTAILERMIAAAGVNPTRASLIGSAAKLGPIGSLALTAGGSFGQGKPDFEDTFRFQIWKASCKCYQPSGDFHAVST